MFEIPTSWTSTRLVWNFPDPLWPLEKLNLCCIEAIKECDSITGRTVPALLSAAYNPIRPNRDYVNAIHSEITALIPLFVNHLNNSGDWNGQATIPNFTEATILTAIGDASRIVPANFSTLSAWYFQTYKILNMLRWVKQISTFYETYYKITSVSGDFSTARAAFIANTTWTAIGYPNQTLFHWYRYAVFGPLYHYFSAYKSKFKILKNSAFTASADVYLLSGDSQAETSYYNVFNLAIEGFSIFNLYAADVSLSDDYITSEIVYINVPDTALTSRGSLGCVLTSQAVLKFDGVGGRKFRDW